MPTTATNINDHFFAGHYQEVWRKLIPPGLSAVECDFVQAEAQLQKDDRVLDLMCGYGRHALELGRRGYQVTAVDNQVNYINEIKTAAAAEKLPVDAIESGVLNASYAHAYKAILCMGNSFAFFDKDEALALLQKVAAHLQQDGRLIINTWMIAEIAIRHFQEREWHQVGNYKYLLEYRFHFHPSRIESEHTLVTSEGTLEVLHGVDYIFTLNELENLLSAAGLRLRDVYSTPKKRKFKMGDNRAYLVIEKTQQ